MLLYLYYPTSNSAVQWSLSVVSCRYPHSALQCCCPVPPAPQRGVVLSYRTASSREVKAVFYHNVNTPVCVH